ncbi:hypothetical protein BYT27DRAFT_7194965, partial [Phlegmacium glaucopus]
MDYGIALQTSITDTGSKLEFLVVKVTRLHQIELKKPAEDTPGGRERVKKELVDYIEERFDETDFPDLCHCWHWPFLGCIKNGAERFSRTEGPWSSNVTSARDYTSLAGIVSMVHEMTRE